MLIMNYSYIRGEYLSYHAKTFTWKLLHAYIDAHSKMLNDEYSGDGV